ncbi:MAG: class I SAM-dependent methyltransferase [Syntrophales bacterium]
MGKMTCGLCGGSAADPLLNVGGRWLVKCAGCGLIYTGDFDQVKVTYREDYFLGKNRYVERWDEFCLMFDALLAKVQVFKQRGKLLDVGAGIGALLAAAKKRGFETKGVESSAWASAFAIKEKGLDVFAGTLAGAGFESEAFDLAVLNHVLEHADAPLELLIETRRVLKKDGLLVLGVPNIGSIMAGIQGATWPSLRPEEHIWHFTRETLAKLLARADFEVVYFEARDNYPVGGWGLRALIKRLISLVSVLSDGSEAMIFFARKRGGAPNLRR